MTGTVTPRLSQRAEADDGLEGVGLAWAHGGLVGASVGGFDADEFQVGAVGEVLDGLGFFDPRVPEDGGAGAGFVDEDGAFLAEVAHEDGGDGAVDAVGFLFDLHGDFLKL